MGREYSMNNRERILSHLEHRKEKPSTCESVAQAARVKLSSVTPVIGKLRNELMVVDTGRIVKNRAGARTREFVLYAYAPQEVREKAVEQLNAREEARIALLLAKDRVREFAMMLVRLPNESEGTHTLMLADSARKQLASDIFALTNDG